MSRDLTPKQEAFAVEYVKTGNATQAYRAAYNTANMKDKTIWARSCELRKNSKVAERVEELREVIRERALVSLDSLTEELEHARLKGEEWKQGSTMVSATMGKAKLHGLIDNQDKGATVNIAIVAPTEMKSADEWVNQYKK
jgi:phage terminase small subunit